MVYLRNLALALVSSLCFFSSNAQPTAGVDYLTTPNLIVKGAWPNTVPASNGGYSGGYLPGYNAGTDTIIFGYSTQTVAQTIAINKALEGSGVQIGGYDYAWKINNNDANTGTLTGTVTLRSSTNAILQSYKYDYSNIRTTGLAENFQQFSGTEWFTKNYLKEDLSTISLSWTGKDSRYWAGYYGPRVRDPSLSLRYISDVCASSPLSSPECPGYAEAYKLQQCSINPLYDTSCSGYAQAFLTQQCVANPLYSTVCPGYANAYYNQQCSISPLYDKGCVGYADAYHKQQCTANALYSTDCNGYSEAYYKQQCSINALYDKGCVGYADAYKAQQCTINSLYAVDCPGYLIAYHDQQCSINPLYMSDCPGYTEAYKTKLAFDACKANPQSSPSCSGYVTPTIAVAPVQTITTDVASVPVIADPIVNNVVSAVPVTSSFSPVSQSAPPATNTFVTQATPTSTKIEVKAEAKSDAPPPSPRMAAAREAAKQEAVKKGKDLASTLGDAVSMQDQIAKQDLIASAMGYNGAFDSYQSIIMKDSQFYKPYEIYKKQVNVDNNRVLRGLQTDSVHRQMIDLQYKGN